ncbi:MAG TPA: hypothetical protein VJV78_47740 [Polyangiales bacterium]|nr:hypothetical protein [Polyangiales bacterium]
MNLKPFSILMLAAVAAGCSAANEPERSAVQGSSNALTLEECADQRDECLGRNQPLGLLLCPLQYNQCVLTASNGIPAEVATAVGDTAMCAQTALRCRGSAEGATDVLKCTQTEADCIADVIGANLPPIVTGTAACIDDAASCVGDAESVADVTACRRKLEACARDEAISALPPEVSDAIKKINACISTLNTCTGDASSPGELAGCAQDEAECVAKGLGVIPPPRVDAAVDCAEAAVNCTLDASDPAALRACAATLVSCNARIGNPDAPLTCEQQWTECLVKDPFNFVQCGAKLNTCRRPVAD